MRADSGRHPSSGKPIRAAAYVRMSTEHQQYSTSNQMEVIEAYARDRGVQIVKIFSDEGKSGLSLKGRSHLVTMIEVVESGTASFDWILVYDVSRWGRFQNADESAYYEYICWKSGIEVHYCAEQFINDGSPMSTIIKGVKRTMAGEYSRELSAKVFRGACNLIRLGYKQGGTAGYGLRRMLVDHTGRPKGILGMGEHKSIQTDRVILVPGPDDEVAEVRWMFHAFVEDGMSESEIASILNSRGILTDFGRPWTRGTVHQILTNEKYIGNNVYHRTSFKLKKFHVTNPPDEWVRAEGAWVPVIDVTLFEKARSMIMERSHRFSDEEMLEKLKNLLDLHGRLSGVLIDEHEDSPSSSAFRHRFGSLVSAYSLIGYTPATDFRFIEENKRIRRMHPEVVASVMDQLHEIGATVEIDDETDLLRVNDEFLVSVILSRHTTTRRGSSRWALRFDTGLRPDLTIAVRMEVGNDSIRDYYIFPSLDLTWERLRMGEANGIELDGYQFDDLGFFYRMAERIRIEDLP